MATHWRSNMIEPALSNVYITFYIRIQQLRACPPHSHRLLALWRLRFHVYKSIRGTPLLAPTFSNIGWVAERLWDASHGPHCWWNTFLYYTFLRCCTSCLYSRIRFRDCALCVRLDHSRLWWRRRGWPRKGAVLTAVLVADWQASA